MQMRLECSKKSSLIRVHTLLFHLHVFEVIFDGSNCLGFFTEFRVFTTSYQESEYLGLLSEEQIRCVFDDNL